MPERFHRRQEPEGGSDFAGAYLEFMDSDTSGKPDTPNSQSHNALPETSKAFVERANSWAKEYLDFQDGLPSKKVQKQPHVINRDLTPEGVRRALAAEGLDAVRLLPSLQGNPQGRTLLSRLDNVSHPGRQLTFTQADQIQREQDRFFFPRVMRELKVDINSFVIPLKSLIQGTEGYKNVPMDLYFRVQELAASPHPNQAALAQEIYEAIPILKDSKAFQALVNHVQGANLNIFSLDRAA